MKKLTIPAVLMSSLVISGLSAPAVFAGEQDKPNMDQRAEHTQSGVKDAWLDGKLESALLFNGHLNSFAIDTEVKSGTAYLTGAVESDIDRDLADEIAQSIEGITSVENKLTVDKEKVKMADQDDMDNRKGFRQSVANATLTARIKTEFLVNSNIGGLAIDVDSRDGDVTLSGDVNSEQEKDLAEKIAKNTSGTRSVQNQLRVDTNS